MGSSARGGSTAAEVIAEKERRLREDPEYRAKVESAEAERARVNRDAEQRLLQDLADIGIKIDSVWDLYRVPDSRPKAIPVLIDHLVRDYPDGVLMGIGIGLDHKSAKDWWPTLAKLYVQTDNKVARDRLAAVLSGCAARAQYEELLSFVKDESLGETRIYFLRPINRIGNRMAAGRGREVLESLALDPVLSKEAQAVLAGRGRTE